MQNIFPISRCCCHYYATKFSKTKFSCNRRTYGITTLFFIDWGKIWDRGWFHLHAAQAVGSSDLETTKSTIKPRKSPFQPCLSSPNGIKKEITKTVISWLLEPKPRFELGTPSLRVKCSTAELFRRFISEFGCKDSTFYYFFAIFARNFYRRC